MRQLTLASGTFETYRKPTRREKFLSDMEKVVPWHDLCAVIAPHYPEVAIPFEGISLSIQAFS